MSDVMHQFELYQPDTLADAQALIKEHGKDSWLIAGGKDSLDWFKDGVMTPAAVIDISALPELQGVDDDNGGVFVGAMTTLTAITENALIKERFPMLADAAGRVASPQIRNVGTIGGNVSQDTRCVYYRDGFPCYRAGGNTCYANTPTAMNREHTLFEAKRCVAVTPSDLAPVCVALEAEMVVQNKSKQRTIPAGEFFIGPDIDIERMTTMDTGDILIGIRFPAKWAGSRQYFEKVAERNTWDFALVNIAMAAQLEGDKVSDLRMACGAVQCTPRRLSDVEDLMIGEAPNEEMEELAARVASSGAKPLNYNHFKAPLMSNLARRAIRSLAA